MRALVTGGRGFVGRWLTAHLEKEGDEVVATGEEVDVTDADAVRRSLDDIRPDAVYHLAGWASVGSSWADPAGAFAFASDLVSVRGSGPEPAEHLVIARRCEEDLVRLDLSVTPHAQAEPLVARHYDGAGIAASPDGHVVYWTAKGPRQATAARLRYRTAGRVVSSASRAARRARRRCRDRRRGRRGRRLPDRPPSPGASRSGR